MKMDVKECINIYQNLVDTIIIQYNNGNEFEVPSEDAEFLSDNIMQLGVSVVNMYPNADYCIIYLDD